MKKIRTILIGTHNDGKFKELSYLLPKKLKKLSPKQLRIKSPKETGKSFLANSKLKSNYFYNRTGIISISDDSGLSISCLKGKPGIFSARWAKKYGSFKNAMKKIICMVEKKNKKRKLKNTKATFICSLTVRLTKKKSINSIGKIEGNISMKMLGKNGFGYDPIFIPKNKKITFGQMLKKKKILMDHRFIAYKKIKKIFNTL
ncbi:MAG: non-canonical purine NTP pyrophosphatase [Pelagibacteraceae bacterium TMED287]|nr:MAG: non-canonical purine NTP pyrophosphatase [Pelagibacteraceae bacterium TMED287]OUX53996.1 MAG: non-canonical purine NTP pyrophosphatase [Pelagibacteraceae bacterium TMED287]|tara:strand:- start:351 stop:956 length:606 start_codon:yes stop_codon:yes gene_type:complete